MARRVQMFHHTAGYYGSYYYILLSNWFIRRCTASWKGGAHRIQLDSTIPFEPRRPEFAYPWYGQIIGQDITKLLGKILRFDVDRGNGKDPARDNPFVHKHGENEIFAYGFRNPYRFSFDMGGDHQLFVGDAGQDLFEEVSIVAKGGNYGWNIKEGTHCFNPQDEEHAPDQCRDTGYMGEPLIDPVIEYSHPKEEEEESAANTQQEEEGEIVGEVVVGGYVYRGEAIPAFAGQYVFGDWSREEDEGDGLLLIAQPNESGGGLWTIRELEIAGSADGRLHHFIVGFGQDAVGELYVLVKDTLVPDGTTGKVYKLTAAPSAS
jgi:hypothetical protein